MKKLFSSALLLLLIITGCSSQPEVRRASVNLPSWISNPNQDGNNGAVGSSMQTYDQKMSTQRKLAITRALDELSLQRGVKVEMNMTRQESYKNGRGASKMSVDAAYQTTSTITAHIQEVYHDKISGELFIWMVLD